MTRAVLTLAWLLTVALAACGTVDLDANPTPPNDAAGADAGAGRDGAADVGKAPQADGGAVPEAAPPRPLQQCQIQPSGYGGGVACNKQCGPCVDMNGNRFPPGACVWSIGPLTCVSDCGDCP